MEEPPADDDAVTRVLALRSFALGDLIMGLPALASLRAAFPRAHIALISGGGVARFASTHLRIVDEVIGSPAGMRLDGTDDAAAVERFAAHVASRGPFDLAVQLFGGGRWSNPFLRSVGAARTVGPATPDAEPLDVSMPFAYYHWEVARAVEVVQAVGGPPVSLEPEITATTDDLLASLEAVPAGDAPIVVIHPGASDPRRRWPAERFAQIGRTVAARGVRVVVTGTDPERAVVNEVAAAIGVEPTLDLSLEALTGLLRRAAVVVGNDTGPLHLARAVGTPTVVVYWCGNLINAAPFGRRISWPVLSWRTTCPTCGTDLVRARCGHEGSVVDDAPLEEVLDATIRALDAAAQTSTSGASTSRDGIVVGSS